MVRTGLILITKWFSRKQSINDDGVGAGLLTDFSHSIGDADSFDALDAHACID